MELTLYMATSLDGFIATSDGDEEFLSPENWEKFVQLAEDSGAFVVGRNTYETVKDWDNHSYTDVEATRIILTTSDDYSVPEAYEVAGSPQEAVQIAENNQKDLVVTGGSSVNKSFADAGLLDRIVLNIEPVLIGQGLNIFDGQISERLKFVRMSRQDSLVTLEYRVESD